MRLVSMASTRVHVYSHLSSWLICHVLRYGDASDIVIIKMRISNNLRWIQPRSRDLFMVQTGLSSFRYNSDLSSSPTVIRQCTCL